MSGGDGPLAPADGKGSKEARAGGREGGRKKLEAQRERARGIPTYRHQMVNYKAGEGGGGGRERERGRERVGRP